MRATCRANIAKAEHAQGLAAQIAANGALPAAGAQRRVFGGDVTQAGEDQRPGEFDRRRRGIARVGDGNAALGGGGGVDRGVAPPGRNDQLQPRQPFDDRARQRRAFAHDAKDVEAGEPRDQRFGV